MLQKRKTRYRNPTGEPVRLRQSDMEILELFGPGKFKQFNYLTAELIASLTNRWSAKDRVNKRCAQLFDAKYLGRFTPRPEPGSGSTKIAYFLATKGAIELKDYLVEKANQKHEAGEMTLDEANEWIDVIKEETRPIKNFNPNDYHSQMDHTLTTNWFRALVQAACSQRDDMELLYQYPDRSLGFILRHQQLKDNLSINPDAFFGWRMINQPRERGINNFYVEIHRSSRKTKKTSPQKKDTIQRKLEDYRNFKLFDMYEGVKDKCPDVENWKNMRVLFLTDTGAVEHENLIKLTKDKVGRDGKSLKLFWFAKKDDFELDNPESLFAQVWRTPVSGDKLKSLMG